MIKLTDRNKPTALTIEIQSELTARYKNDKKLNVWNQSYIKEGLWELTNGKCAYCECKLGEESKDLTIDHFYPKHLYEDEVVEWQNLLPACLRCNRNKGIRDTKTHAMIHPVIDDPQVELEYSSYRITGKTQLGKDTVKALRLNDTQKVCQKRFEIGSKIIERLDELADKAEGIEGLTDEMQDLKNSLESIMEEGKPDFPYSATISTIILNDNHYRVVRELLKANDFWDSELTELENILLRCALPLK